MLSKVCGGLTGSESEGESAREKKSGAREGGVGVGGRRCEERIL
jgi:hypothetical protein